MGTKMQMKQLDRTEKALLKVQEKMDEAIRSAADKAEKRVTATYGSKIKGLEAQIADLKAKIDGE